MRSALVCLLALAACGRDEATIESVTRKIYAEGIARLVVIAKDGHVELRTGGPVEITVASPKGVDAEVIEDTVRITGGSGKLRLTVPPGLDVVARVESGGIDLGGSWRTISLTVLKGDVRVATDAIDGGTLTAQRGNVDFTNRNAPTESIKITAPAGNISLAISSKFRGLLQLSAPTIETPVDKRVAVRRTEGTATVFVGKGFTREEHEKIPVDKRPGIWATAKKVSFSLTE